MASERLETFEAVQSNSESVPSESTPVSARASARWLKVGAIAAASALAGGLAAAWWYRKTLRTLRQSGETGTNPKFGILPDDQTNW